MRILFLLGSVWASVAVSAQTIDFSFGGRAGLLLNRRDPGNVAFGTQQASFFRNEGQRYVFGPVFEVGLGERWGVEFAPTYRREGWASFVSLSPEPNVALPPGGAALRSQFVRDTARVWDLPVSGKFYFRRRAERWRPFAGAGAVATHSATDSFRLTEVAETGGQIRRQGGDFSVSRWGFGPVATAGVQIRYGRLFFVPEFRYLRDGRPGVGARQNRAELFLGLRF